MVNFSRLFAALILSALLGCGDTRNSPDEFRHIVLTNVPDGHPTWRMIRSYGRAKLACGILRFADLRADRELLLERLISIRPHFITVIAPPRTLDLDMAFAMQDLARDIDDDPFVDALYGFLPAIDDEYLRGYVKAVAISDFHRNDTRFLRYTQVIAGGATDATRIRIPWAESLHCLRQTYSPDDPKAPDAVAKAVNDGDFVLMQGPGGPEGLEGGVTVANVKRLNLNNMVLWGTVPGSAVVSRRHLLDTPVVRVDSVPVDRSFACAVIGRGAIAWTASLLDDPAACAQAEAEITISRDVPVGEAVKETYDLVTLALPGDHQGWPHLRPGAPTPPFLQKNSRIAGAAARILMGDPSQQPPRRANATELLHQEEIALKPSPDPENRPDDRILEARMRLTGARRDLTLFMDPFRHAPDGAPLGMLHLKIEIPPDTPSTVKLLDIQSDLDLVPAASAIEDWLDRRILHVVLNAPPETLRTDNKEILLRFLLQP